jgi:hypothetical protein
MALSLALAALLAGPAFALDTGDIVVESVKGGVRVTMNGAARSVRAGGALELPATIDTGRDGAIDLRQGSTTISVGPETRLEFPALEQRGGAIDRIVQPRGNAFYNIGKRAGRRLRVETPYLVGVIKGTQFNVAAQDDATTISLFEGALEIRASDDSSVVDLAAGEIASRKRGGHSISVMKMEGGSMPPPRSPPAPSAPLSSTVIETVREAMDVSPSADGGTNLRGNDAGAEVATNIDVNAANAAVDAGAGIDVGSVAVVDLDAGASVGASAASVGTAVSLDVPAVDIAAAANVDLGAGAVDVGASAAIDTGAVTADTATAVAVDVGASSVAANVDLSTSADVGNVAAVDAGAGAAVDLGTNVQVAANVDVGANVAGVAAAVNAGADVAAGSVDLGVNVAGVDLGVNLDLDLDDDKDADTDNSGKGGGKTPPATTPVVDVGGVLDGILNRHRKK